jgi:hypothetical protein
LTEIAAYGFAQEENKEGIPKNLTPPHHPFLYFSKLKHKLDLPTRCSGVG